MYIHQRKVLQAVIGGSVQLFYARRIWVLMHNFIIVSVIVALSIMSTGFAIASSFVTFHWIAIVWLSAAAATDVLITSVLVWQLVCPAQLLPSVWRKLTR